MYLVNAIKYRAKVIIRVSVAFVGHISIEVTAELPSTVPHEAFNAKRHIYVGQEQRYNAL